MLKYVYSIISSADDYIVEQALVSMYSLKKHNPDAKITLVSDEMTLFSLEGCRGRIREYIDDYITIRPPENLTAMQKSRFLKTSLRQNIVGDFVYLDNDTIVMDSLSELDNFNGEMGAVLDCHALVHGNQQVRSYLGTTKKPFWNYEKYFNGGMFIVKDSEVTRRLFLDWHTLWSNERITYGISIDQPSFAQANVRNECCITELSGIYNYQLPTISAKKFLFDAKIIHYSADSLSSSLFALNKQETLKEIREKGVSDKVRSIINNPVLHYLEESLIVKGEEIKHYLSPMGLLGHKLSRDYPWTNIIGKYIYRLFGYRL